MKDQKTGFSGEFPDFNALTHNMVMQKSIKVIIKFLGKAGVHFTLQTNPNENSQYSEISL